MDEGAAVSAADINIVEKDYRTSTLSKLLVTLLNSLTYFSLGMMGLPAKSSRAYH
jgi:hypothetical protein